MMSPSMRAKESEALSEKCKMIAKWDPVLQVAGRHFQTHHPGKLMPTLASKYQTDESMLSRHAIQAQRTPRTSE